MNGRHKKEKDPGMQIYSVLMLVYIRELGFQSDVNLTLHQLWSVFEPCVS